MLVIIMSVYLYIWLLLVARSFCQSDYSLTPLVPPPAFQGQYYTLQFRVIGLDNPSFTFGSLPSFFISSVNGTIEGTPNVTGSFSVRVSFNSGGVRSYKDVVLRVAAANAGNSSQNYSAFTVMVPDSTFTFVVGNFVYMQLSAVNGRGPYIWSITSLPPGIYASTTGVINGSFLQTGYYTVNVQASDSIGAATDCYLTFNIQPLGLPAGQLVQVANRYSAPIYNLTQLQQQQIAATKTVYNAARTFYAAQITTNQLREKVAITTTDLEQASQIANNIEIRLNQTAQLRATAECNARKAQHLLNNATRLVELATTAQLNSKSVLLQAQKRANASEESYERASTGLNNASQSFIAAQNDSYSAGLVLKTRLMESINATQNYQSAFNKYSASQQVNQAQLDILQQAGAIVDNARNALALATQSNDDAYSFLLSATSLLKKSQQVLTNVNELISNFTTLQKEARTALGEAQFNLTQAMNTLFVAQARKAEADKATMLVYLQTSKQTIGGNSYSATFAGCDQKVYPSIVGSAAVQQVMSNGYGLSSGHSILFGSCTVKDFGIRVGILIQYSGFVSGGYIQATKINIIT